MERETHRCTEMRCAPPYTAWLILLHDFLISDRCLCATLSLSTLIYTASRKQQRASKQYPELQSIWPSILVLLPRGPFLFPQTASFMIYIKIPLLMNISEQKYLDWVIKISFNPIILETVIKRLSQRATLHGTHARLSESDINLTASFFHASHKSLKLISQGTICHTRMVKTPH